LYLFSPLRLSFLLPFWVFSSPRGETSLLVNRGGALLILFFGKPVGSSVGKVSGEGSRVSISEVFRFG